MGALFYALVALSIATMLTALWMVGDLRRIARGGKVGRTVNVLRLFIIFFTAGYFVSPWLPRLPAAAAHLIVGLVFFGGAVFVVLVLRLLKALVKQVFDDLRL